MPAARLGHRQLELLAFVGTRSALVCSSPISRRLCALGLMEAEADGSFARITPAGLRALADAAEAGRVKLFTVPRNRTEAT